MILEAMKRLRALERRVDALEVENAALKAARVNDAERARAIDEGTKDAPERKRAKR